MEKTFFLTKAELENIFPIKNAERTENIMNTLSFEDVNWNSKNRNKCKAIELVKSMRLQNASTRGDFH